MARDTKGRLLSHNRPGPTGGGVKLLSQLADLDLNLVASQLTLFPEDT
jgi:hypothetical protein